VRAKEKTGCKKEREILDYEQSLNAQQETKERGQGKKYNLVFVKTCPTSANHLSFLYAACRWVL